MNIDSILVCGSRGFDDYTLLKDVLDQFPLHKDSVIISGGAKGADRLGEKYAHEHQHPCKVFPANWDKHGRQAGYIRNKQMINLNPDLVIAFWDGVSKGTRHTIGLAKDKKIMTVIVYV